MSSDENIANSIAMLVDATPTDRAEACAESAPAGRHADRHPEVGVYHPRLKGGIGERAEALPRTGKRGTVGKNFGLRSYMLA